MRRSRTYTILHVGHIPTRAVCTLCSSVVCAWHDLSMCVFSFSSVPRYAMVLSMNSAITPPVGSFNTITVFSRAVPYVSCPTRLVYYRKRDGSKVTQEELSRAAYVRLVTHEEHAQGEARRIETVPARYLVAV